MNRFLDFQFQKRISLLTQGNGLATNKFNKVYSVSVEPDEFLSLNETRFIQTIQLTVGQLLMFDGMSMRDNWRELGVDWLIEVHQNL